MAERYLSEGVIVATAKDFLSDSVDLQTAEQEEGITYEIQGYKTSVRTEQTDGATRLSTMPTSDFIGGVVYALAEKNEITKEEATPNNVGRICFALGYLMAKGERDA